MKPYLPFADWMKATGMALIVYGHVAFFVFVTGYTLARERRAPAAVVFNRYFEVFAWGLLFALALSAVTGTLLGQWQPSNYLPLAGGLQIFFDNFPANPTTWYIGTYFHLLVLWALLLRRIQPALMAIAATAALEITVRAAGIIVFGHFVAYMLLTNWITVLLFGLYAGRGPSDDRPRHTATILAAVFVVAWPLAMAGVNWNLTFPFMLPADLLTPWNAIATSAAATAAYSLYTASAFTLFRHLPQNALVTFLARNTVIIFIAHMPLYYLLEYLLRPTIPAYGPRVILEFVVCFVGLAGVSEALRRTIDMRTWRDRIARRIPALADAGIHTPAKSYSA